ncbi:hypothetical protein CgunFtcFv8_003230 [Champsocephalus gunnari]|uniref:Uncharacterized protein n=1 Tax=Champsocephalus gunnari TaxID=52237 RepID=A0AAN8DAE8_CHAGU|nr:hypothetical protein CgunFtcFv8_003230 [Champsocephalus gunnari]
MKQKKAQAPHEKIYSWYATYEKAKLCPAVHPTCKAVRSPEETWTGCYLVQGDRKHGQETQRRGPIWEVQCKQSRFLIIPAHVRNWTHFDVLPQRRLRPPIARSQTAELRARQGNVQIVSSDRGEEAFSTFWDTEKGGERM